MVYYLCNRQKNAAEIAHLHVSPLKNKVRTAIYWLDPGSEDNPQWLVPLMVYTTTTVANQIRMDLTNNL